MNSPNTDNPPEPIDGPESGQPASDAAQSAGPPGAAPQPTSAPGYPGYPYAVRRPTNGMAIAAMVTGIVALFSCQLVGAVAIYLARRARTEIATSGEEGSGFATAGLVLGWVALGLVAMTLLFVLAYLGFVGVLFATGSVNA